NIRPRSSSAHRAGVQAAPRSAARQKQPLSNRSWQNPPGRSAGTRPPRQQTTACHNGGDQTRDSLTYVGCPAGSGAEIVHQKKKILGSFLIPLCSKYILTL